MDIDVLHFLGRILGPTFASPSSALTATITPWQYLLRHKDRFPPVSSYADKLRMRDFQPSLVNSIGVQT